MRTRSLKDTLPGSESVRHRLTIISLMESEKQDETSLTRIPHWRVLDSRTTTVSGNMRHPGNATVNIDIFHRNNGKMHGACYILAMQCFRVAYGEISRIVHD